MIRTILFLIAYFTVTTLAIPFALSTGVLKLLRLHRLERFYVGILARGLASFYLRISGARVEVEGREHLEGLHGRPLCIVSNHQGMADIPVIVATMPFPVGFIAKKSLLYFPWVGIMMWALRCVPIDRSSPRSAIKAIDTGIRNIKNGFPMLIFPEGTRSRGKPMAHFKKGSLKLALRSNATILPLSINGSYHLVEETGRLQPTKVSITFHAPVPTAELSREERDTLITDLEATVASAVKA